MERTRNAKRFLIEYAAYLKRLYSNSYATKQEKKAIAAYIDKIIVYVDRGLMTNSEAVQVLANMNTDTIKA